MANLSTRLGYVCHSCRKAVAIPKLPSLQASQVRTYSNTQARYKSLATFTPTSSPELDALFSEWRNKVFIPSVLATHHQKLIYKEKHHDILNNDPGVSATFETSVPLHANPNEVSEEETIRLWPMRRHDEPHRQKSFATILSVLGSDSSATTWDNLIPFLDGLRQANIAAPVSWLESVCRKANMQDEDRWETMIQAATQVKRTNFRLSLRQPTKELVLGAFLRAVKANFKTPEPKYTFGKIVVLLDKKEHCNGEIPAKTIKGRHVYHDMRRDPIVLATKLVFTSNETLFKKEGKDTDGLVTGDLAKLLALDSAATNGIIGVIEDLTSTYGSGPNQKIHQEMHVLIELMPVYCALYLANKVDLKPTLKKENNVKVSIELQRLLQSVKTRVNDAQRTIQAFEGGEKKERRCWEFQKATEAAMSAYP